jgi:GAF domain-containing protein
MLIEASRVGELPKALVDLLQPDAEVLALPMVVGGESIGLLVVDNKFTRSRITERDIDVAMEFVLSSGPSLQNTLLFNATTQAAKWAEKTHTAAHILIQSDTPEEAADGLMQSVGAQGVGLVLCNAAGEVWERYTAGKARADVFLRPSGISVQVMAAGAAWWTPDAQNQPGMNQDTLLPDDRAMTCLPMRDHGQIVGVAWLSFTSPLEFERAEIERFQECVDSTTAVCRVSSNR